LTKRQGGEQALVEFALGKPMTEASFALSFPTPAYADRYREDLHGPVVFGANVANVSTRAEWLELPCPFADGPQHQLARPGLEVSEQTLDGQGFIVARVQRTLEGYSGAPPGADEVAKRLHLSRRTLVRRPADYGTSFRALTDRHRRR
jgi:hypothetical protein